jgi:hypothetical protein
MGAVNELFAPVVYDWLGLYVLSVRNSVRLRAGVPIFRWSFGHVTTIYTLNYS